MKLTLNIAVLALLFAIAPSVCFALREVTPLTTAEAKKLGIEIRAKAAGPDAVWLELEFKPDGNLKEFTHVELKMTEGEKFLVLSAELRETRSSSGNVVVSFT